MYSCAEQAAKRAVGFATQIAEAPDLQQVNGLPVSAEYEHLTAPRDYAQWKQKLQMVTQYDIRSASWRRTAAARAQSLPQIQHDVNGAQPDLWTELEEWVEQRKEELSSKRYNGLSVGEKNAWVEWLEELQGKVREAHVAGGIKRAVTVIVSCLVCIYQS